MMVMGGVVERIEIVLTMPMPMKMSMWKGDDDTPSNLSKSNCYHIRSYGSKSGYMELKIGMLPDERSGLAGWREWESWWV